MDHTTAVHFPPIISNKWVFTGTLKTDYSQNFAIACWITIAMQLAVAKSTILKTIENGVSWSSRLILLAVRFPQRCCFTTEISQIYSMVSGKVLVSFYQHPLKNSWIKIQIQKLMEAWTWRSQFQKPACLLLPWRKKYSQWELSLINYSDILRIKF